ncbi:MAG TPA: hypothetical protein VMY76_11925, partial [Gemmatimonadales bacterium]|nr:hypothetical protein [Gemmatimonadales bacterium]
MAEAEGILIVSALSGLLGWRALRATRVATRDQLHLLDPFLPLVGQPHVEVSPLGFPVLRGLLDGHALRLELVPDTLAFRSLPVLYLEARWARPHTGRLRVVVQPTGAEYFGDDHTLTKRYELRGWSVPCQAWGEGRAEALARRLEAVDPAGAAALKLVSVREDQLCVTFRFAKAEPSAYRVLRRARFETSAVDSEFVTDTLRLLRAIE